MILDPVGNKNGPYSRLRRINNPDSFESRGIRVSHIYYGLRVRWFFAVRSGTVPDRRSPGQKRRTSTPPICSAEEIFTHIPEMLIAGSFQFPGKSPSVLKGVGSTDQGTDVICFRWQFFLHCPGSYGADPKTGTNSEAWETGQHWLNPCFHLSQKKDL